MTNSNYTCQTCKSRKFILQLHINSQCNQRCFHCYQDDFQTEEMSIENLSKIVHQYLELLQHLNCYGHINITGGEPLLHSNFFKILEIFKKNKQHFGFGILSNGTLIDKDVASRLRTLEPRFVQLSIEGNQEVHDSIRGKDNLKKIKNSINILSQHKIKTLVSFTAHKNNYKTFGDVVKFCQKSKVFKLWTDRMVPFGGAMNLNDKFLSPEETMEYLNIIAKYKFKKPFLSKFRKCTIVESGRALQFLTGGGIPYRCKAGESLLTVMEDGTMYPCRRLPLNLGNINTTTLLEIYSTNETVQQLKDNTNLPQECEKCRHKKTCRGGAKCLSYALTGNMFSRDPGCMIH